MKFFRKEAIVLERKCSFEHHLGKRISVNRRFISCEFQNFLWSRRIGISCHLRELLTSLFQMGNSERYTSLVLFTWRCTSTIINSLSCKAFSDQCRSRRVQASWRRNNRKSFQKENRTRQDERALFLTNDVFSVENQKMYPYTAWRRAENLFVDAARRTRFLRLSRDRRTL
mgnify:CR=1 FL=1